MNEQTYRKIQMVNDDIAALTHRINYHYEKFALTGYTDFAKQIVTYQRELMKKELEREELLAVHSSLSYAVGGCI